ncbi:MAG: ABC transporter permease, partial [Clostridia bacterium]|nr:ABC transporter permease [Clostridia bacterium]
TFTPGSGFMSGVSFSNYDIWEQMLPGSDGGLIDPLLKEQYDVIAGRWPENEEEIVLVVDENNELNDFVIWSLGLRDVEKMRADMLASSSGKQIEVASDRWEYGDLLSREFRVIPAAERYVWDESTRSCTDLLAGDAGADLLWASPNAVTLKISGIIRKNPDAVAAMLDGYLCYTSALTDRVLEVTSENELIKRQTADPSTDVISGLPFGNASDPADDAAKIEEAKKYISSAGEKQRAAIYRALSLRVDDALVEEQTEQFMSGHSRKELEEMISESFADQMGSQDLSTVMQMLSAMSDEDFDSLMRRMVSEKIKKEYEAQVSQSLSGLGDAELSAMLGEKELDDNDLLSVYENFVPSEVSESTYEENLKLLGWADKDSPTSVSIYCRTFADKEKAEQVIKGYNDSSEEASKITYTDYVAQMMSGVSTIINAISYVLMAFVSVSLVVSSIMIGIITYISVLERTKEIGILRAVGASKNDVSRVFNAETFIVGLCAGVIGILVTLVVLLPINLIIHALSGVMSLNAALPLSTALLLIALSLGLTMLAGFLPSRLAAKKDPVEALRSE